MNKSTAFDHNQHPNQESKRGFANYASSTKLNFSTNDSRIEQFLNDRDSWWIKVRRVFRNANGSI
jgi:hypothetical protein